MKVSFYRLGEHKIIETGGALGWEAHAGLGSLRRGRCFISGDILFIEPGESEEPGFLKKEFLERLRKLPQWDKTKYYCSNYSILDCQSGRKLTPKEIFEWAGRRAYPERYEVFPERGVGNRCTSGESEVSCRLGQYVITEKTNGEVGWKTYSDFGRLRAGSCVLAGDILFLSAGKREESGGSKEAFLDLLNGLPQWSATRFYCPNGVIHDCMTGLGQAREAGADQPPEAHRADGRPGFTPPARTGASYPPFPSLLQTPLIRSSLSFLNRISGKTANWRGRIRHRARPKEKGRPKTDITKSVIRPSKTPIHFRPFRMWVAYIGALVIVAGALLLALLHDYWDNGEGHRKADHHSTRHHRDR